MAAAAPVPDIVLPNGPADTVSSLHFAPRAAGATEADYLCATAWDGSVSVYEINASGQCLPRAKSAHAAPVLCSAWSADGTAVISGACDNSVRLWNVSTNQMLPVGMHEAPVRAVFDLSGADAHCPQICSGSWDKTIKYWDVRAPGAATASVALSDRVYAMDVKGHVAAVACAERQIHVIDLRKPTEILKSIPSPLKFQSRSISIFPDQSGFAVGSIEVTAHSSQQQTRGRVAIVYLADPAPGPNGEPPPPVDPRNFAFKCHRAEPAVFSVNAIQFHPKHGTFVTVGGDGIYTYWDKDSKQRLKVFPAQGNSILTAEFNPAGTLLAYAVGYDWSEGMDVAEAKSKLQHIALHRVVDSEICRRPPEAKK